MRALLDGRLEEAGAIAERAYAFGHPVEPRTATMHYGAQMWLLSSMRNELAALEEAVRGFVAEYPRVAAWRVGLVTVLLAQGRIEEAAEAFREFTDSGFEAIPRDAIWSATCAIAAEVVAAGLGDPDDARRLHEMMRPFADRNAVTGEAIICLGPMSLYVGSTALAMGEPAEAIPYLEDALGRCERMGARPFEARAAAALAAALQARDAPGDSDRAAGLAARAEQLAAAIGQPVSQPA
jgi:tetratricopeptide (TPR) repeat protein